MVSSALQLFTQTVKAVLSKHQGFDEDSTVNVLTLVTAKSHMPHAIYTVRLDHT